MDERELLRRARDRVGGASGRDREQNAVDADRQALGLVGHPEDAADVTQEALLKAWRGLPAFQGGSSFSTWLYRLTGNAAIDLLRRERKRRGDLSLDDPDRGWDSQLADPAPPPEKSLEQKELRRAVVRALALLSEEHRQVLVLRELNGASYEEMGRVLDLPPGTVKSRVARARLALAKLLREEL